MAYYSLYKELVDAFKDIRISKKVKHEDLAKRIRRTRHIVNRMENFKHVPSLESFIRMCEELEYTVVIVPMSREMIRKRREEKAALEEIKGPLVGIYEKTVDGRNRERKTWDDWEYDDDEIFNS